MRAVRDRLRAVYGRPVAAPHGRPLDELMLTVLSQSTNDRNRDVAFLRLRARLEGWAAVRDAPVDEVERAIRPGGISRVKSGRIQAILRAVSERPAPDAAATSGRGVAPEPELEATPTPGEVPEVDELSLAWIEHAPVADSRRYLCDLPGVGRKTAACVLLFSYGRRDVPVDTHVSRVAGRLGLLDGGVPLAAQHDAMLALTPRGQELELHVNLLRHGRRTCHARWPECPSCALARMCPSRRLFAGAPTAPGGVPAAR